jgi:hypothetical protein
VSRDASSLQPIKCLDPALCLFGAFGHNLHPAFVAVAHINAFIKHNWGKL